jgi:hypothetical protein
MSSGAAPGPTDVTTVTAQISVSLLDNAGDPQLEPVEVIGSPAVTHVRYRVVR